MLVQGRLIAEPGQTPRRCGIIPSSSSGRLRRLPEVRDLVNSSLRRTSIHVGSLPDDASRKLLSQSYGWSHFGVDCMAHKYGEAKLFNFVKGKLRDDLNYDEASQRAYGAPFELVDKACVTWIDQQL